MSLECGFSLFFFFQAEDGIRDLTVTGVQTCALPISTANTLVVMSISPLLTVLLARLVLSDPVRMRTWLAAAAAGAGIAWMFGAGLSGQNARHLSGMLVALAIPFASAINVVTLRAAAGRLDLVPALVLGGAIACALSLPFALPFSATPRDLVLLGFLGFFQLGLPCMLVVIASRSLLAPEIALLGLLEVVLGPLWAWLGAGEIPPRRRSPAARSSFWR